MATADTTRSRRTKLVCTIGPATVERVGELVEAGMDVARINSSHGTPASRAEAARAVRAAEARAGRPIGLLVDLSGPKVRLGALAPESVELEAGRPFALRPPEPDGAPGNANGAAVSYDRFASDVRVGDPILLADGAAELRVTALDGRTVRTIVARGGTIRSRAGVAIAAERLSLPAITDKDRVDVDAAVAVGADFIGQSFVRSAADVLALRDLIGADGPAIVAKIETRPAVDAFDAILEVADGAMIARGDLGVELPFEEVPLVQKQLVRRALEAGVPSIVATQMLESMTAAPRPTRAEANDVANAVFDRVDAIMLSGETAIGAYPLEAARAAASIADVSERSGAGLAMPGSVAEPAGDVGLVARAAVTVASREDVAAIVCRTRTGRTARVLASLRPRRPIVAFSPDPAVVHRLTGVHGVAPRALPGDESGASIDDLLALVARSGLVRAGEAVVIVSSSGGPGSGPNQLAVERVGP
jgi:pyruvate kinase